MIRKISVVVFFPLPSSYMFKGAGTQTVKRSIDFHAARGAAFSPPAPCWRSWNKWSFGRQRVGSSGTERYWRQRSANITHVRTNISQLWNICSLQSGFQIKSRLALTPIGLSNNDFWLHLCGSGGIGFWVQTASWWSETAHKHSHWCCLWGFGFYSSATSNYLTLYIMKDITVLNISKVHTECFEASWMMGPHLCLCLMSFT